MPQLLGLIFDLEGTLINSAADVRQSLNRLLAAHGRRPVTMPEIKDHIGGGLQSLLHHAFAITGKPLSDRAEQTAYRDLLTLYRTQKPSADQLYPQTRETLAAFHKKQIKIGLCTNRPYQSAAKLLDEIGIAGLFDFVAGFDTFPVCKPHPGHVLGVAKGFGISPQNCAMIGDSPNDMLSARGAGVACIAVSHGYSIDAKALGADAVISGFAELPQTLRTLGFDFPG